MYDSTDEYDDNISFQKPESLYNDNYIQNEFDQNIELESNKFILCLSSMFFFIYLFNLRASIEHN